MTTAPLDYYARHKCALFPIPAGSKAPGNAAFWSVDGAAGSFKKHHSSDPAQWAAWSAEHPGCNFGLVAFASRLIVVDIDTKIGIDAAWALWCGLCAEWQIPVAMPHVRSARGGWHVLFAVPADLDPSTLRQPDAIKSHINVRCIGYVVAAGSYYDGTAKGEESGHYQLLSDAAPYPAPAALVEHCTRKPAPVRATTTPPGSLDPAGTATLLEWLNEREQFTSYEDWLHIGMALKLEFGDAGFDLWSLCHDQTVTPDTAASKWESFATEPDSHSVTLLSFMQRAHKLGWKGSIGRSAQAMFGGVVAQIAAGAGAALPGAVPMLAGQEELTRLATPLLEEFLTVTTDAPGVPLNPDFPTLPETMAGHGLYSIMTECVARVFALADAPKFKPSRVNDPLAVLHQLHPDVFESVCRRLRLAGHKLDDRRVRLASAALQEAVERVTVTQDKWEYDSKGEIQSDNPDNVVVLLGVLSLQVRWNAWLEQMEIQGGTDPEFRWPEWTYVDDTVIAKLLTRSRRTKTRFRPGKDFLWETLITESRKYEVDPILDHLATLESEWDGTPRLASWLTRYCGAPADDVHRWIGILTIGGMVLRARVPGCKFDFMPVLYGVQGSSKSTLAAVLADMGQTSLAGIKAGLGRNFTDNVMFGDAAKELVLSLAGVLVAEIGEMGTRSNTNVAHVKAMISRPKDEGRTAYARAVTKRKRRNIFIGTTNDDQPLTDPTGNRRFLPVHVRQAIDLEAFARDIRQLVGEAAAMQTRGERFELPPTMYEVMGHHQEHARQASDIEVLFDDWFGADVEAFVTKADLVRLCDAAGRKNLTQVVRTVMYRLGYEETSLSRFGGKEKVKIWYRARGEVPPKDIPNRLPQYQVDVQANGGPRVVLRPALGAALPAPPIPLPRR
ncbi:VapE domain-containing protein [Bradyrhizobium sp. HKCCYLS2038]|uniref:VapE domain-containing protein n=1 Tax=Bradyrhizobium sp. HKCCYLS2038 TaxID=3420764 RepID=UPI003EBF75AB